MPVKLDGSLGIAGAVQQLYDALQHPTFESVSTAVDSLASAIVLFW
jgi:hypothetical protein